MFDNSFNPLDDLRSVLDTAAQKTAQGFEHSHSYMERMKLKNALNEKYRQLGKAEYEYAVGETDDTDPIDTLVAEITELRNAYVDICKVLRRDEAPICPRCGKKNTVGNSYCSECGARLYTD